MFGVFIQDSYISLLKRNWDFRFEKFVDAIKSWTSRILETLFQRVEVLKLFAFSRIYYVASVLPINKTMVKKFEKEVGKFLWNASGRVLRVSLEELKKCPEKGGLGVHCLLNKSKALMLSQLLRLLKSDDRKCVGHVGFWIGESLGDLLVGIDAGQHAQNVPAYFENLSKLVVDARASDTVKQSNWRTLTSRMIYQQLIKSLPVTKVEQEAGISYKKVWERVTSQAISSFC